MNTDNRKQRAAQAALEYVQPNSWLGVGTGSTVNLFIDALIDSRISLSGAVSSSHATTERLVAGGIEVVELAHVLSLDARLSAYVDGADEIDGNFAMIKGGGGALTREKIVAAAAEQFVCIVDDSKCVNELGAFALPVEVIQMAVPLVMRAAQEIDARPVLREGFMTDNGHPIVDLHGLKIADPVSLETAINQWAGVVTVGLFARRPADICLSGGEQGVLKTVRPRR